MPLPEEWDNINWEQSVVILPDQTEGIAMIPISRLKYPNYPRGYYMLAFIRNGQPVIGYNAADVGAYKRLVSEFVFWHEIGHHWLGHTGWSPLVNIGVSNNQNDMEVEPVSFTKNKELEADKFAFEHWMRRNDMYGLQVINAAIDFFHQNPDDPGDAEHPPAMVRCGELWKYLRSRQLQMFKIDNDDHTPVAFVLAVLTQVFCFSSDEAQGLITEIERTGSVEFSAKGTARTAQLMHHNEAIGIMRFIEIKMLENNCPNFRIQHRSLV